MFPCLMDVAAVDAIHDQARKGQQEQRFTVSASHLIGYTSNNLREVGGTSLRLGLDVPPSAGAGVKERQNHDRRFRPGIYIVVLQAQQNKISTTSTSAETPTGGVVGLGAIPPPEDVGENRIEVIPFQRHSTTTAKTTGLEDERCRFWTEEEIGHWLPDHAKTPGAVFGSPAEKDGQKAGVSVYFLRRIADFSHLGVGPWLRDQILRHQDNVNEAFLKQAPGGSAASVGVDLTPGDELPFFLEKIARSRHSCLATDVVDPTREMEPNQKEMAAYWTRHGGV
ncbi:unnamed protein product [Amoebophrya sp. A120]|nr:unnamed protein product [Amoebophrya sp. A120]|eukprot:GSA120T00002743001.1